MPQDFPAEISARPAAREEGRADTHPGTIYLNTAAAGLMPPPVFDAVVGHLRREVERGALDAAAEAVPRLEATYAAAARLLGADPDEIALVESGNRGLAALIGAVALAPGDRVLVAPVEWGGSLAMLSSLPGVSVEPLPTDEDGALDLDAARRIADGRVRLVLLTLCPATGGLINPGEAVGAFAREIAATYLVDACQAVGQLPVDVRDLGCDGLAASGRKWLRGPRGTGLLYASRDFLRRTSPLLPDQFAAPLVDGAWRPRADARRFEGGEAYVAGRLGLGAAIEGTLAVGVERLRERVGALATRLRAGLASMPGVQVHDRVGPPLSGIVAFTAEQVAPSALRDGLAARGVTVGVRGALYAPFDMLPRRLPEVVRASPSADVTEGEIDRAVEAVADILRAA
jgi:cysteine desulfurase/selenocysteine lyase